MLHVMQPAFLRGFFPFLPWTVYVYSLVYPAAIHTRFEHSLGRSRIKPSVP